MMIGLLFFVGLGIAFFLLIFVSKAIFDAFDHQFKFYQLPILLRWLAYSVYIILIFMIFLGDEFIARKQHQKMCEKYAYLKFDRASLLHSDIAKDNLKHNLTKSFTEKPFTFTDDMVLPMRMFSLVIRNKNTGQIYLEQTTIHKEKGWATNVLGINLWAIILNPGESLLVSMDNTAGTITCQNIDFKGKELWEISNIERHQIGKRFEIYL